MAVTVAAAAARVAVIVLTAARVPKAATRVARAPCDQQREHFEFINTARVGIEDMDRQTVVNNLSALEPSADGSGLLTRAAYLQSAATAHHPTMNIQRKSAAISTTT